MQASADAKSSRHNLFLLSVVEGFQLEQFKGSSSDEGLVFEGLFVAQDQIDDQKKAKDI